MSAQYTLRLSSSTDFIRSFRFASGGIVAGPLWDLTACSARLELRSLPTDTPLLVVSTTPGAQGEILVLGGASAPYPHRLALRIFQSAIAALSPRPWPQLWHRFLLIDANQIVKKLLHGPVEVCP